MRTCRSQAKAALALSVVLAGGWAAQGSAAPPDDPLYAVYQWGPQQVRAEQAWAVTTGAGVVIAIVDSGVDLEHPDLAAKLVPGATFVGCPSAPDGCGSGDWEDGEPPSGGTPNASPHGSHVAGIAAAATGNAVGIAGVARDARIMPVKVLMAEGGTTDDIAAGIEWAVAHGARVINLSLGGDPGTQAFVILGAFETLHAAIEDAIASGVVVIASAGNDAASACGEPAFHPDVLCVVATDRLENRAAYSNFPIQPGLNVVAAPGGQGLLSCEEDVISTVPASAGGFCSDSLGVPGYDFFPGTSMSAPHVAGIAALLVGQGRSAANVLEALRSTARTPGTGQRGVFTPTYGFGIVDAQAAVAHPEPPEPVPLLPRGFAWLLAAGAVLIAIAERRANSRARRATVRSG